MPQPARSVTVIGAGYVGLVTAAGLASLGHRRGGLVETRPDRLAALREGRSPIHEAGVPETLAEVVANGRLTVADRLRADCRPGDEKGLRRHPDRPENGRSDLSQLDWALRSLAPILERPRRCRNSSSGARSHRA